MQYRREIDGLRAIAVLPVILFHGGLPGFAGGYVGVDVFFVISGYLITTILLGDIQAGRFSILRFYERRARRILPALFVMIAFCMPFAWLWMMQTQLKDFFESVGTTAVFASNFLFWSESGYFDAVAEEKPLLHTWSLAVEEQYYVVFPILLALLCWVGKKFAFAAIALIAAASLSYAMFGGLQQTDLFFLTHPRIWELLIGSLCAFLLINRSVPDNNFLSLLGLCLILYAIFFFTKDTRYPLFAILPVVGTALIILFAASGTWAAQFLSWKPFVGVGLISFSAYLWHQPLFAFARIRVLFEPHPALMVTLVFASLGLATLSWRYVEQPFRGNPSRLVPRRAPLFAASIAGIIGFFGLGVWGNMADGFPERKIIRNLVPPLIDARHERFRTWAVLDGKVPARFDLERFSDALNTKKLLLIGDSHSKGIFNALYQNPELFPDVEVRRLGLNFECLGDDTVPQGPERSQFCFEEFARENAKLIDSATHIGLAARWHNLISAGIPEAYAQGLLELGTNLFIISPTVEYDRLAPDHLLQIAHDAGFNGTQPFPKEMAEQLFFETRSERPIKANETMRDMSSRLGVRYLQRDALICDIPAESCTAITPKGEAVYYDYGHWTLAGAKYFGQEMARRNWLALE